MGGDTVEELEDMDAVLVWFAFGDLLDVGEEKSKDARGRTGDLQQGDYGERYKRGRRPHASTQGLVLSVSERESAALHGAQDGSGVSTWTREDHRMDRLGHDTGGRLFDFVVVRHTKDSDCKLKGQGERTC